MMNVGENRAQNGVLDCPESKNEEKFLSIGRLDSSRYAMEGLRILRGTRCLQNIKDSSGNLRDFMQDLHFILLLASASIPGEEPAASTI
ncbi:hypothetical protein E3N88_09107 [Mikania micrantha]|uniref:Uncharacterized protein n=1 Tax=Mikania micrantha TaxID=192012 RepID=A0A5N6PK46_9ASTR|nr:hypothetical protein E3N88_09107 [Mikania micrantha]